MLPWLPDKRCSGRGLISILALPSNCSYHPLPPTCVLSTILNLYIEAIDNGDNDYKENYANNGNDDNDVEEDIDCWVSCQLAQSPDSLATDNICLVIIIIITLIIINNIIIIIRPIPLDNIRKEVPIDASFTWPAKA